MPKFGGKQEGSGRKKFVIDYETVEKLASLMCTQKEIASYLDCHVSVLEHDEKFKEVHRKGLDKGKMSIRRHQYRMMEEGNATMGIWLGKQYLGQRDKQDIEHHGNVGVIIEDDINE